MIHSSLKKRKKEKRKIKIMERVIVLGLSGCSHCKALTHSLVERQVSFEYIDADKDSDFADRMEALLKTNAYPMVILEKVSGSVYLFRAETIDEAQSSKVGYGTKIGCVSTDAMIELVEKYNK